MPSSMLCPRSMLKYWCLRLFGVFSTKLNIAPEKSSSQEESSRPTIGGVYWLLQQSPRHTERESDLLDLVAFSTWKNISLWNWIISIFHTFSGITQLPYNSSFGKRMTREVSLFTKELISAWAVCNAAPLVLEASAIRCIVLPLEQ